MLFELEEAKRIDSERRAEISGLQQKTLDLTRRLDVTKIQLAGLSDDHITTTGTYKALASQNDFLRADRDALREAVERKDRELQNSRDDLRALIEQTRAKENDSLNKHKDELNVEAAARRELRDELNRRTQELETQSQKYNNLKATYEEMRKTLESVKV